MPDAFDAFGDIARSLAEHHRVAKPKCSTPRHREQDLVRDPRLNPDDWEKLRAAPEWTADERQRMDADHKQHGEDHAYFIWKGAWDKKWHRPGRGP